MKLPIAKIDHLCDVLDNIKDEIQTIEYDWDNLDSDEQNQIPKDLSQIESHLRKTATLFTHLKGRHAPDWGSK